MQRIPVLILIFTSLCIKSNSQTTSNRSGTFSLGTRYTTSLFGHEGPSNGLGGQFRLQFSDKLNSEWFADYITSSDEHARRNDYHIGWSLMFYPTSNRDFSKLLQPYLLAGHCFDYTKVIDNENESNFADRLSMAMQAGAGLHFNVTREFDFSISGQYMIHLGKEIETSFSENQLVIEKQNGSGIEGHLLATISINYKIADFW